MHRPAAVNAVALDEFHAVLQMPIDLEELLAHVRSACERKTACE
jgi:hypothetical protein